MDWKTYLAYAAPIDVTGTKWENPASISDDIKVDIFKKYSNLEILSCTDENGEATLWVALSHAVKRTDAFTGAVTVDLERLVVDANDMLGEAEFERLKQETGIVCGELRWMLMTSAAQ